MPNQLIYRISAYWLCHIINEVTYFIQDNGAGFDMAYVDKIFIPFQRLHDNQYNGTGVGLATVERIIKRHRGKISAKAKPNEGAKFSFTIRDIT